MKKFFESKIFIYVFLLFSSFVAISVYSCVTSPFISSYCHDSSMFEVIGKGWSQGMLPYRDLWDSKGPYVFFINMVAYAFTGRSTLFVLEIINLYITKIYVYKMANLKLPKVVSMIIAALSVSFLIPAYWYHGNTQSEWSLPFLACSLYLLFKYSISDDLYFNPKHSFVLGITLGICIMSRPTNAAFVAFCIIGLGIWLIYKKQWASIFKSIAAGIAGIAVVSVPFITYFAYKNCLYDMYYAAFVYNMKYVSDGMEYINLNITIANLTPLVLLICYSIISIKRRDSKQIIILWLPILLSYIYIYYLTFAFIHYFSIFLPAYALTVIELCDWCKEKKLGMNVGLIGVTYVILINGLVLFTEVLNYDYLYARRGPGWDDDEKTACELYEMVPEGSTFASINEPVQHVIYLKYDVLPRIKYFYYQDTVANIDMEIIDDMVESFKENEPEYVLYSEGRDITIHPGIKIEDSIYKDVLKEDYTIIESRPSYTNNEGDLILLKRK